MKKTISFVLLTLFVVATAFILVACGGGVKTEAQWNDAMEYLKNCDAVTINSEKNEFTNLHMEEKIDVWTVTYDESLGILYAVQVVKDYKVAVLGHTNHNQVYAVVEGTDIKYYTKSFVDTDYKNWEVTSINCDSEDDALLKLRELYVSYVTSFGLDKLNYNEYTLKLSKYEKSEVVGKYDTIQQVTFVSGKLSNYYSESKPQKGSSASVTTKINISLQYSAEITAPTDLEYAIWK